MDWRDYQRSKVSPWGMGVSSVVPRIPELGVTRQEGQGIPRDQTGNDWDGIRTSNETSVVMVDKLVRIRPYAIAVGLCVGGGMIIGMLVHAKLSATKVENNY